MVALSLTTILASAADSKKGSVWEGSLMMDTECRSLARGRGIMLRPGRWVEWRTGPVRTFLEDGRIVEIFPGDWVLIGRDGDGRYTRYLWIEKRTVN